MENGVKWDRKRGVDPEGSQSEGNTVCIGEGNVVSPGMLNTDLACTGDGPVILIQHSDRELSGNLHSGIGGVAVYDNDLTRLQGLIEDSLQASRDLCGAVANRDNH